MSQKRRRIWKRIGISLLALLVLMLAGILGGMKNIHFRFDDERFRQLTTEAGFSVEVEYIAVGEHQVRSIKVPSAATPSVVFLHGAPGSGKDFEQYLTDSLLAKAATLITLDRPGYGYSDYGSPILDMLEQARVMAKVIPDSSLLVAHSYGGPIAAAMAMCCPEKTAGLLLLAPAIDPYHEKEFAFNNWLRRPPLSWFTSGAIKVAIAEKMTHAAELEALMDKWDRITCPVTIMHGQNDWIVPDENVAFLEKMVTNAPLNIIHPEQLNHTMIWDEYDLVRDQILRQLSQQQM